MAPKKNYDINITLERLKNYCALEDKSKWHVIQKMKEWGLIKEAQEYIIEVLIKEKYLDEERFARSFCRGKFRVKGWGKEKIKNELKKKKISESCIKKGLQEIQDFEYQNELNKQFQKKNNNTKEVNHFKKKQKIAKYLISKGYENNMVWNKLRELKE